MKVPPGRTIMRAHASQVVDALYHVLFSAVRMGREGGDVACRVDTTPQEVRVRVHRPDAALSSRDVSQLFTKFHRAEATNPIAPDDIEVLSADGVAPARGRNPRRRDGEGNRRGSCLPARARDLAWGLAPKVHRD